MNKALSPRKHQFKKARANQLSFFKDKAPRQFGGALLKGHAKAARPLSTKEPVHLVLKSAQAFGSMSMLHSCNARKIDRIIRTHAKLCRVRIYHFVNVGNHLHLVIKLDDSREFAKFIRSITGLIARHVLKAERGSASGAQMQISTMNLGKALGRVKNKTSFWIARPFTRLIAWGRDYGYIKNYMEKNRHDAQRSFVPWGFDLTDPALIQRLNTG